MLYVGAGMRDADDTAVAEAILGYLAERPKAMDDAVGIAEWWIPSQRIRTDVEKVSHVLRSLAAQGKLEVLGPEECPLYRLNTGASVGAESMYARTGVPRVRSLAGRVASALRARLGMEKRHIG